MNAYNYDTQQWESGADALKLRLEQIDQTLGILNSGRSQEYCRFVGITNRDAMVRELEQEALQLRSL